MAVLPPKKGSHRRPSMRGNLLQDVTRGVERNRAWPSPRLSNQTKAQKAQQDWFRQANWAFKFLPGEMQDAFRRATHLTSLYPRDLFTIMVSGGLIGLVLEDGQKAYPMATRQAVSESLDALSQQIGYTLVRGPQFWTATPQLPQTGVLSTRIRLTGNPSVGASPSKVPFNTIEYDEIGLFDPAQPNKLTVPAGVSRLQFGMQLRTAGASATNITLEIRKNGQTIAEDARASGFAALVGQVDSGPVNVAEGDVIEFYLYMASAGTRTYAGGSTSVWARFG